MANKLYAFSGDAYATAISIVLDLDENSDIKLVIVNEIEQHDANKVLDLILDQGLSISAEYSESAKQITVTRKSKFFEVSAP